MTFQTVSLSQLEASAGNPRKAFDENSIVGLAQSIKADGLLQNLVVAKPKGRAKKFTIISGERRFRAMQHLLSQGDISQDFIVHVEVKENLTDEEILRIATIENVQRESLTPLEKSLAISALVQNGEKLEEILAKTGLSIGVVKRRLALLNLIEGAKEALSNKEISLMLAEALAMGTIEQQEEALDDISNGYLDRVDDIKERFFGNLPSVADAIFPKELYTESYSTDLLSDDKTTFFNDVDQFLVLQRDAASKLVEEYQAKREWGDFVEGSFSSWQFKRTTDGDVGGTVICMSHWGGIIVHDNLIKPNKMDTETASPALHYVQVQSSHVFDTLAACGFKMRDAERLSFCESEEKLYDVVIALSDEQLMSTLLVLSAMEFGQFAADYLDTSN